MAITSQLECGPSPYYIRIECRLVVKSIANQRLGCLLNVVGAVSHCSCLAFTVKLVTAGLTVAFKCHAFLNLSADSRLVGLLSVAADCPSRPPSGLCPS